MIVCLQKKFPEGKLSFWGVEQNAIPNVYMSILVKSHFYTPPPKQNRPKGVYFGEIGSRGRLVDSKSSRQARSMDNLNKGEIWAA